MDILAQQTEFLQQFHHFADIAKDCYKTASSRMTANYIAVVTILVVIVFSFLIPDIAKKLQEKSDLKTVKSIVTVISKEVAQAEQQCHTAVNGINCVRGSIHDQHERTEINVKKLESCVKKFRIDSTRSEPMKFVQRGGHLRKVFNKRYESPKEVTIMSYLYTDSFDSKKPEKE